ncbi:MAG: hypothetical protein ACNA8L_07005 [Luteolibacter sp.]
MRIIPIFPLALLMCLTSQLDAQTNRRSLLDDDPNVVYLNTVLKKPLMLTVVKEAPVFSDYEGRHRLGTLRANQEVEVEAITDKVYRVRGQGLRDGIAGWVAPWAFRSSEPEFVEILKKFYQREIAVKALIAEGRLAIGMTFDEVRRCKGEPNQTSIRRTQEGQSGTWEYIEYQDVKHYTTHIDPVTRQAYRTLSHITREESGKLIVEFENGLVTAFQENKQDKPGNVRIIVPPIVFGW